MKHHIIKVMRPVRALPFKVRRCGLRGLSIGISVATGAQPGLKLWQYVMPDGSILLTPREMKT